MHGMFVAHYVSGRVESVFGVRLDVAQSRGRGVGWIDG